MINLHISLTPFRNESRVLKMTETLVRRGLVQHVYVAALYEEGLNEHEVIDGQRSLWRVRLRSRKWSRSLIVQLVKYIEYCSRIIWYARSKKIDLVNVHALSLLPLGALLKWIIGAKLVYDTHELETETYGLTGVRQTLARCVERHLIGFADLVVVVGDGIKEWYRTTYGLKNIATILNCPVFHEPRRSRLLHDSLGIEDGKRIVIYQGALVRGRGIERLLSSFSELDDDRHVLVLMGYGELEPVVKHYSDTHKNIYVKEAVEPALVLRFTESADVGVSYIDNPSKNDHLCLPNKLFEYIMAGLPVIVSDIPEQRRVVTEHQLGVVLNELSSQSLRQAFDQILKMDRRALSLNLRRASHLYSWDKQESNIQAYYEKLVGAK